MRIGIELRRNMAWVLGGVVVVSLLVLYAVTWANYQFTLQYGGGYEFVTHWLGARLFLFNGISPYGDEAAVLIRAAANEITPGVGIFTPPDENLLRFVTPLYSIVLYLPYVFMKTPELGRAIWMTILEAALVGQALLAMKIVSWRPGRVGQIVFVLVFMTWYPSVQSVIEGNPSILVSLFVIGGLVAIRNKGYELAGVLFAFTTIKINVALLFVIFILGWAYRQRNWKLIGWFFGTIVLLGASVTLLMPDWLTGYMQSLVQFFTDNPLNALGGILSGELPGTGERIGWLLLGIMAAVVLLEWAILRRKEYHIFLWTASLTLVASQWIGVRLNAANLNLLFPVLVFIFWLWGERWKRVGVIASIVLLVVMLFGVWGIYWGRSGKPLDESSLLLIPLPVLLMLVLYWVRWWAIRSPNLWFDSLAEDFSD
jgi:hypothetical protein